MSLNRIGLSKALTLNRSVTVTTTLTPSVAYRLSKSNSTNFSTLTTNNNNDNNNMLYKINNNNKKNNRINNSSRLYKPLFTQVRHHSDTAEDMRASMGGMDESTTQLRGKDGVEVVATDRPLYLDLQATTPTDPRVLDAMLPYMTHLQGNPHSVTHRYGWETHDAVEDAREHVANLINAGAKEIVFTSGATESNNIAIKGIARFYKGKKKTHLITTQTEHKCVLDSCRVLENEGFEVTYLPVGPTGLIDLQQLKDAIRPETSLISIMAVNNEIGVIQPLKEIGQLCKENKIFFHTDAAQAYGKIPLDVEELNISAMSISGHKIYGPKGIGALYVRRKPRVRVEAIQNGGGQERNIRSGTVPTPLVVGLGAAAEIAAKEMEFDHVRIQKMSKRLIDEVQKSVPHIVRNGSDDHTYPGCVNLSFAYIEGESLLMALKDMALSSGSACTSASLEPSYVLRAIGAEEDLAHSSIRFGIGRFTTDKEIDFCIEKCIKNSQKLRDMSPLWEMVQEGIDLSKISWSQH